MHMCGIVYICFHSHTHTHVSYSELDMCIRVTYSCEINQLPKYFILPLHRASLRKTPRLIDSIAKHDM